MKKVTIAVVTVAVLAVGGLFASNTAGMQHFKGAHHMGKIIKQLDLTSEQKQSLKSLRGDFKKNKMIQSKVSVLRDAMDVNGFNKGVFIDTARKKFDANIEKRAQKFEQMYEVLTASQRVKLMAILDEKKR